MGGRRRERREREKKKHFQEWVFRSRQRVLFPDSWGPTEHRSRGKGSFFSFQKRGNSWSWHQPSSFSLYCSRLNRRFQLMGPSPYNCQEAVAFKGCLLPIETLLCAWCLMNVTLRRENPKQCSFLGLIYVNHEHFHKWNKRYSELLVWSDHAHLSWPIHPFFDSFCQDWGTCPQALLIPSTYFSLNCQCAPHSNCSHTPRNIQLGNISRTLSY